jgi:dienelactone hydrolase
MPRFDRAQLSTPAAGLRPAIGLALCLTFGIVSAQAGAQEPPVATPLAADQVAEQVTEQTAEQATANTTAFDPAKEAVSVLDAMDAGDFAAVHARFDATMAAGLSVERLREVWTTLPNQTGAARGRGEAATSARDGLQIVQVPLRYERAELLAILAFAADGKLAGFAIRPATAAQASAATAYAAPPLPANARFVERELVVGDPAKGLGATLALPKGKGSFPAVVLVHGSGPQDRDETIGPNKPFLDIARGLAERGVAVLRYDKRSHARPQDYGDDIDVDRETTDDAVLAVAALRKQPNIDPKRIFVFGHSQGGMMAPRIAQRSAEAGAPVAGLILLAAPSRPLLDILVEQTRRMAVLDDGKTSAEESAALADIGRRVAAVRRGGEVAPADSPGGLPAAYWRSMDAVNPVAEARALSQPMLILQGAVDIQVVDADWQGWKAAFHATPRVGFKLYETLNHLGMPGSGTLGEYQTPGRVDPGLIADVAAWIDGLPPRKKK